MEKAITRNILRFVLLLLLQGLIFHRIHIGGTDFNYIQIFVYPLFIMLLPIQISKALLILLGFLLGISIDVFYDSPGLHASAATFSAFIRPFVLGVMQPRGGYKINALPNKNQFGFNWFVRYASILMAFHLLWYFMVEAFQFSQILQVLLKTICSFIASIIFITLYVFIFNPRD